MKSKNADRASGVFSREELKAGIENLRPLLREITNAFIAHTEAKIAALSETVRDLPEPDGKVKAAHRQEKLLHKMQARLTGLKVQPEKGRPKDFRRIRNLLGEFDRLLPQKKPA